MEEVEVKGRTGVGVWGWIGRLSAVLIIVIALGLALQWALGGPEVAQSGYNTACYREQGGDTWVCSDGGSMRFESGSSLTSEGTVAFSDLTLTGDLAVVNAVLSGDLTAVSGAFSGDLTVGGALTVTDEIVFGPDQLYALGVGLPGFQLGGGRVTITGTATFTSATGIPWTGQCTLSEFSANYAFCTLDLAQVIAGTSTVTITVYDLTGTQAVSPTLVNWLLIGQPSP